MLGTLWVLWVLLSTPDTLPHDWRHVLTMATHYEVSGFVLSSEQFTAKLVMRQDGEALCQAFRTRHAVDGRRYVCLPLGLHPKDMMQ